MKKQFVFILGVIFFASCASPQPAEKESSSQLKESVPQKSREIGYSKVENDKVTISNPEANFEVVIFDIGFDSWLASKGKPRGFYNQVFLEAKNRSWVNEWNNRSRAKYFGYDYTIDYLPNVDYGYEVNYMLYNYLLYWQESNQVKLD